MLTTFLDILGSLHGNRKRPVIIFSSKEQKYSTAFFFEFLQEWRQKGEERAH